MAIELIEGWVATTRSVPKYGGVALAEEALAELAAQLRSGKLPFLAQHDVTRNLGARVISAEVRDVDEATKGVWVRLEVPEGAIQGLSGFSYGAGVPIETVGPDDGPLVDLYADADRFSAEQLRETAATLAAVGYRVEVGHYVQFAAETVVAVILVTVVWPVLVGVGSNVIYDSIKELVATAKSKVEGDGNNADPEASTEIRILVDRPDGGRTQALIRSDDPDTVARALDTLSESLRPTPTLIYENGEWRSIATNVRPDAGSGAGSG